LVRNLIISTASSYNIADSRIIDTNAYLDKTLKNFETYDPWLAVKDEKEVQKAIRRVKSTKDNAVLNLAWKNNWFFVGPRLGMPLHWYAFSEDLSMVNKNTAPQLGFGPSGFSLFAFDPTVQIRLQIPPKKSTALSLQVDAIFTKDMVRYDGEQTYWYVKDGEQKSSSKSYKASFESWSLEIPILLKLLVMPQELNIAGRQMFIAPFGGIYITIPLAPLTDPMKYTSNMYTYDKNVTFDYSTPIGWIAGTNVGIRLGPGDIFIDIRFSQDIGNTSIEDDTDQWLQIYRRSKASFSLGYEFGLGHK
jgi:hypothetical protein